MHVARGVIRYHNRAGYAGKLFGEITFTDGRTLKVWDADLHAQCKELAAERVTPVTYEFQTSAKWGDSLRSIRRQQPYEDAYDAAREADEQRGRFKANSYGGRQLGKAVRG